jgi:large subunit ribosomal protein L2
MIFFDLGLFNKNSSYIKASGTFSQILQINKDLNLILILLPSGNRKYVSMNYLCTLGRNNNIFKKFIVVGKAGLNRNKGRNVTVRGVAMNPIDHPHGGRTKTNKPEVSP